MITNSLSQNSLAYYSANLNDSRQVLKTTREMNPRENALHPSLRLLEDRDPLYRGTLQNCG